jgi:hypothetical protein
MKNKRLEPIINIRLEGAGQMPVFQPRAALSGIVEIQPDEVIKCRQVFVTVGWHTEGRGDRNGMDIYVDNLPITEIRPEAPLRHQFETTLLPEPWSYGGSLIRIVWEVHVKIDIPMATDINQTLQFILAPAQ